MYKVIWMVFALACLAGLGWWIYPIREADRTLYAELSKSSNPDESDHHLSYSQHKRHNVCKQVWYQDETPLYFRIDSEDSELFFFRQHHQVEVIEQLENVNCIMQEELYYEDQVPMQKVRYLQAERASYNYNTQLFVAEKANLWKYQLEGHEPPTQMPQTQALMRATAQSVEFTLKGEKLNFVAHQMKATLNSKERAL